MARILIIEDDENVRAVLAQMLSPLGHDILTARDGVEAMAVIETIPLDLVVTDLCMPRMDGIQTIRTVRQRFSTLKFIAISGAALPGKDPDLDTATQFGAQRTLSKPFTRCQLVDLVEDVLADESDNQHNASAELVGAWIE